MFYAGAAMWIFSLDSATPRELIRGARRALSSVQGRHTSAVSQSAAHELSVTHTGLRARNARQAQSQRHVDRTCATARVCMQTVCCSAALRGAAGRTHLVRALYAVELRGVSVARLRVHLGVGDVVLLARGADAKRRPRVHEDRRDGDAGDIPVSRLQPDAIQKRCHSLLLVLNFAKLRSLICTPCTLR
eukprot:TRINITY_DN590_c0_g1_i3.p1 TRINITY_DN590_c0_g1~~TRINITY_DN590_c0_g1_i3.p1  ORF type:complete len:189 (+),score=7.62 TRINITY_DN590_c0_g1_i3:615-1181(+)